MSETPQYEHHDLNQQSSGHTKYGSSPAKNAFEWSQPQQITSQQTFSDHYGPSSSSTTWLPSITDGRTNDHLPSYSTESYHHHQQQQPFAHVSARLQSRSRTNSSPEMTSYSDPGQQAPQRLFPSNQPSHPWVDKAPSLMDHTLDQDYSSLRTPHLPSVYTDWSSNPHRPTLDPSSVRPLSAGSELSLSPVTCVPPTFFNYAPAPPMTGSVQQMAGVRPYTTVQQPSVNIPAPLMMPTHLSPIAPTPSSAAAPGYAGGLRRSAGGSRSEGAGPDRSSKQFKCDICPQSFNRNHDLKRHKRIHLAIKPFPCGWCEKTFSRKDALRRHFLVRGCGKGQGQTQEASEAGVSKAPGIVAIRLAIEEESRRQNCALPASAFPPHEESSATSASPSGSGSPGNSPDMHSQQRLLTAHTNEDNATPTSCSESLSAPSTAASDESGPSGFQSPFASGTDWRLSSGESLESASSGSGFGDAHVWTPSTLSAGLRPMAHSSQDPELFQYIYHGAQSEGESVHRKPQQHSGALYQSWAWYQ